MDLDDLLDDVDISALKSKEIDATVKSKAKTPAAIDAGKVKSAQTKNAMINSDIRPWIAASANAPKELRDKWTKMIKIDTEAELLSRFQPSIAYCDWDSQANPKNNRGVNKCLQELVRTTITKCNIDESKASKIMTLINPVTDSENGKHLQLAFTKQLIKDLRVELTSDPNYDPKVFKNLANALVLARS